MDQKEELARVELKSNDETRFESGLSPQELPKHIAVVMDGNRRYGLQQYNDPILGHWDGSKKLVQFVKWCVAEQILELTVYAFSTENWSRSAREVSALMNIIIKHCEELRIEAIAKQISIHIKSTDTESIPVSVREVLCQLEKDTYHKNPTLRMNICLSYGSRGEIVHACRSIVREYQDGNWTSLLQITEDSITQKLLIGSSTDTSSNHTNDNTTTPHYQVDHENNHYSHPPDIFLRTSGEMRLSNFLLWQMAYTELFFLNKNWPELTKDDFLNVLRSYAYCRQRRFGR
jgi:undecaprenyl diphosphate synthase